MTTYFDTSALVKRYIAEPGSDAVDSFVSQHGEDCVISPLVTTEFESVLQRLTRTKLIDASFAGKARRAFQADMSGALWAVRPFDGGSFGRAGELLRDLPMALKTLDALHLASSIDMSCTGFATSDRQLANAAAAAGLAVHTF